MHSFEDEYVLCTALILLQPGLAYSENSEILKREQHLGFQRGPPP
jgi:hypothetical protein